VRWPCSIVLDCYIDRVVLANVEHAESRFLQGNSTTLLLSDGCRNLTTWIFAKSVTTNTFNSISKLKILLRQQNNLDSLTPCPNLALDCCFFMHIYYFKLLPLIIFAELREQLPVLVLNRSTNSISGFNSNIIAG
jgi:hypothetical protein